MSNITTLKLYNVPFNHDYKHTLYFETKGEQQNYFSSLNPYTCENFTYQKADSTVRLPIVYEDAIKYNYVTYYNDFLSDVKVIYAFITDYKFINDGVTEITISTDVIQTWLFDYTVQPSFIEREHVDADIAGLNTIPENLETGEYICNDTQKDPNLLECYYIVHTADTNITPETWPFATNFGGIPHGGGAYICDSFSKLATLITELAGVQDAIMNVYMIPKSMITYDDVMKYEGDASPLTYTLDVPKITKLNGYVPKNKKLLTYPYCAIVLSNNNGSSNILKPERFTIANPTHYQFQVKGCPIVGGSIKCSPLYYNNVVGANEIEGIICGKFPVLSWSADNYTNWLTQNSVNIALGLASSGLQIAGGIATTVLTSGAGAAIGGSMVMSGVGSIVNQLGAVYQHSFVPDSARGNTNGGDINTASKCNTFYFLTMTISAEYARIIDNFFTMYGYKTNKVKTPNKNHRTNFWYTKTIDCNVTGSIPSMDIQKIKDCYNNGITFWKSPANIYNYTVNNDTI